MESDGFSYIGMKDGLLLVSVDKCRDADMVIPSVFDGDPVFAIGPEAFKDCTWIRSVSVPEGVRVICPDAFGGCSGLEKISLPASLEQVAERTFYGCTALREVHVPDLMAWCRIWFCDYYANPLSCADDFFVAGEKITDLVIPTGVEEIQDFAFCGFRGLRSLVIPSGVTKIGMRAFYRCRFLSSVTIGKDVEDVGGWAFDDCFGVAEIVDLTPDMSVTKTLEISDIAMNVVDREGDRGTFFERDGYTFYKFEGGTYLTGYMGAETELLFPVTEFEYEIADRAFKSRHDVTFAAFPICCRAVGSHSFDSCLRLTIVDTGPGIELIDFDAFSDCISLVKVIIGENVKRIEKNAFEDCDKIVEIANFSSLKITPGSKKYGGVALSAKNVFTDMGGSNLFETKDFTFYRDENGTELMFYSGKGGDIRLPVLSERYDIYDSAFFDDYGLLSVRVPGCVRKIGKGAFCQCDLLSSVTIEDGVESIETFAFEGSAINCVVLPKSVRKIGGRAFSECLRFERVYYLGYKDSWEEIDIDGDNEELHFADKYWYSEKRPERSGRFWHYADGEIAVW